MAPIPPGWASMIPPFDGHGNLPPGIHRGEIRELADRFGVGSPEREVETKELIQLVGWARQAGVVRLVIDGSYVTDRPAPNDVDLVLLPGPDYPRDQPSAGEGERLWPFLHVLVAADAADLERWAFEDFGTDRDLRPKGVVEVIL